ncbi:MAG: hypothetical protein U9P42_08945, partial [Candidatus Fermentibacteria bacterium]|nr:hypothetical protein [Candidatus Fermentibacteria bacterium]
MKKLTLLGFLLLAFACGEQAEEAITSDADTDVESHETPEDIATNPEALLLAATDAVLGVNS